VLSPLLTAVKAWARSMPGVLQCLAIEAHALDGDAAEVGADLEKGLGILVDHCHRMSEGIEIVGQQRPDTSAAEDDNVHGATLHARAPRVRGCRAR
jgi:hypothetical protein